MGSHHLFLCSIAALLISLVFSSPVELWGSSEKGATSSPTGTITRLPVNLHGVTYLTKEEGWVVGQLGKIFHTTNGGKSWEEQRSGTNWLLTAVDFVDPRYGWAVGEKGLILHSVDGGQTWQRQESGVLYPLFSVRFLDQEQGWAVGHWGTILMTKDGGQHWVERSLSLDLEGQAEAIEPAVLHDVVDPQTREIIVKAGQLLTKELLAEISKRSIRGVRIREDVVLNAVFFLDNARGWIVGERGLILRTEDGGESWERTVLPRPSAAKGGIAEEMGEAELEALGVVAPLPSLYGVFVVSPSQGWVVGQEGTIARTEDGGRSWELQPSNIPEALYDVGMVGKEGWIVGDKGTVFVSTDGGKHWEKKDLGLEYRLSWLRRLAVVPGDHAFFVGADGLVLVSGASAAQGVWIQKPGAQ